MTDEISGLRTAELVAVGAAGTFAVAGLFNLLLRPSIAELDRRIALFNQEQSPP